MAVHDERSEVTKLENGLRIEELWQHEWFPRIQDLLATWDRFDLSGSTVPELMTHVEESIQLLRDIWVVHFFIVQPVYATMNHFDEFCHQLFDDTGPFGAMEMLEGFENKTLETGHKLWDLSRVVLESPALLEVFKQKPADEVISTLKILPGTQEFLTSFRDFLDEYGKRSDLWGLTAPSWIEDPTPAINCLKDYIARPDRNPRKELARLASRREQAVAAVREHLESYPRPVAVYFDKLLKAAQTATILSEDHGFWIDVGATYRARRVFIEVGRRFAAVGVITEPDDIWFLHLAEIRETAAGLPAGNRRKVVAERKADFEHYAMLDPPDALGTDYGPPPEGQAKRAFEKFAGSTPLESTDPRDLHGSPGSPGKARGVAKVMRSIKDAAKLEPCDVLVAKTTSPAWTPLFAAAGAVVTDTGGILSHCAVVAREYAIPAVVGAAGASDRIMDGQILEVNGDTGTVRIVD
jgi:pyruvate,water dikinase